MVSQVYYCEGKSVLLTANGEYREKPKETKSPANAGFSLEVGSGVEPLYADLQSVPFPYFT